MSESHRVSLIFSNRINFACILNSRRHVRSGTAIIQATTPPGNRKIAESMKALELHGAQVGVGHDKPPSDDFTVGTERPFPRLVERKHLALVIGLVGSMHGVVQRTDEVSIKEGLQL